MASGSASSCRLSVAMIVRDAPEALWESLHAVSSIADELVVLDTGSQDDTIGVAERAGAKVVRIGWDDDFSAARNAAWEHLHGDWVLWLDAGESLTAEDAVELKRFVEQSADSNSAYAFVVRVPGIGSTVAAEQVARVRLLPRRDGIRFEGRIRETVEASLAMLAMTVEGLPYRIHRASREHDPSCKLARAQRNRRLAERQISESGATAELWNCLGEAYHTLQDQTHAGFCFRQALAASAPQSSQMLEAYYGLLTVLDRMPDQKDAQMAICLQALDTFPLDAQLLCAMGNYLHAAQRVPLAMKSFETAYRHGRIDPRVWHLEDVYAISAICLSVTQQNLGQDDASYQTLLEATDRYPDALRLHRQLVDHCVKRGLRDEAVQRVGQMPLTIAAREAFRSAVRGAGYAQQGHWVAAKAYLQTAYRAGCREAILMRWFALTLTACGDRARAIELIGEWRELDPGNPEVAQYLTALQVTPVPAEAVPAETAPAETAPIAVPMPPPSPLTLPVGEMA